MTHKFFIIFIMFFFYACRCKCTCDYNLGCKTMVALENGTNDTLVIKKFCSKTNFDTDEQLRDSARVFYDQYYTATSHVETKDSIYSYFRRNNLQCDETDSYTKGGFGCECAK